MTRCGRCDQGERRLERRARLAERDGRTALVLDVPVEVCPACGQVWLTMPVAKRLDELFNDLLRRGAETAQAHWDGQPEPVLTAAPQPHMAQIDIGEEVARAAAAVAWAAEEAARRVMRTSRLHEEARQWHDGELDEGAALRAALATLDAHIDRLSTYLPDESLSSGGDPIRFIGDQGWDFGGWMQTKMEPLKSARNSAYSFWNMLRETGESFQVQTLGKTFQTRPEMSGALKSVAHYGSLMAEMLMDRRVEGHVFWIHERELDESPPTRTDAVTKPGQE